MADPKRREQRCTYLNASIVPVERAMLARASVLEQRAAAMALESKSGHVTLAVLADEFRALADELHWWLPSSRSRLL